jgi:hypothetical protein
MTLPHFCAAGTPRRCVKKRELERHLAAHSCRLARQAAKHEFWENPATGQRTTDQFAPLRLSTTGSVRNISRISPHNDQFVT